MSSKSDLIPYFGSGLSLKCFESALGFASSMTTSWGTAETVNPHGDSGLRRRRNTPRTAKWNKSHLRYEFMAGFPEAAKAAVVNATKEWERCSGFSFSEASPADIKIAMHRGSHGDGYPFDGGKVLAHAFYPPDGRLHFDGDKPWSDVLRHGSGGGGFFDMESVALHELGHVLGLKHSACRGDVMYPEASHRQRH